ncbi:hypothetical protein MTQ55_14235 [Escherichia coli]|nr:hypothetical protein [Escherichia coli]
MAELLFIKDNSYHKKKTTSASQNVHIYIFTLLLRQPHISIRGQQKKPKKIYQGKIKQNLNIIFLPFHPATETKYYT